jgi:hypothetical protein
MKLPHLLKRLGSQNHRDVRANGGGAVDSPTRRSKTLPTTVVDRKEQSEATTPPNPNPNPNPNPTASSEPPTSSPAVLQSSGNGNNAITSNVTSAKEASRAAGKEAVVNGVVDGATLAAIAQPFTAPTQPTDSLQTASNTNAVSNGTHSSGDGSSADDSPLTTGEIKHIEDGPHFSHEEVVMNEAGALKCFYLAEEPCLTDYCSGYP